MHGKTEFLTSFHSHALIPPAPPRPSLPPDQTAFEMRLFKKTRHNNARSECTCSLLI